MNIGDGLTLLHIGAQFGNWDIVKYLADEENHPLEVCGPQSSVCNL